MHSERYIKNVTHFKIQWKSTVGFWNNNNSSLWWGDEGLNSHDEEEHEERAGQVGLEHLISHLRKLKVQILCGPTCKQKCYMTYKSCSSAVHTFPSMCVSLKTNVKGVMCSLRIRSLLRTSMACLILLLISRDLAQWGIIWLGNCTREPLVKVAKI